MKAVILAAGQGIRIRDHHILPKGFLEVGGQAIIEQSIAALHKVGIEEILLVTGYSDFAYRQLAERTVGLSWVHNPYYAEYASLYSLYCAKDWVDDDVLLLESDILYQERALSALLAASEKDVTLLSGTTCSGDEVYVQAAQSVLANMSKQPSKLEAAAIVGEFVGITKLSQASFQHLMALAAQDEALQHKGCYEEQGLVALSADRPIHCLKLADLLWCEIDNIAQWERAIAMYPQLRPETVGV